MTSEDPSGRKEPQSYKKVIKLLMDPPRKKIISIHIRNGVPEIKMIKRNKDPPTIPGVGEPQS